MTCSTALVCDGVQVSHLSAYCAGRINRACKVHISPKLVHSQWWKDTGCSVSQISNGHHTWGTCSGCKQVDETV